MGKKKILGLVALFVVLVTGVIVAPFLIMQSSENQFGTDGYVLGVGEDKKIEFSADTTYKLSVTGTVQFADDDGVTKTMNESVFLHYDDDSISALSDGILLDFSDLSANFINNYYITSGIVIEPSGLNYIAYTETGTMTFGEHLWKLSDSNYVIVSDSLTVHFSDEDEREVSNFVEIHISDDGIVSILTEDNLWTTISDQCYILTKNNVKINPVTQIIDDGTYKITISKLVVSPDDTIVLTSDEIRRQIVPEINIEAIDGADGTSGVDGSGGDSGDDGTSGSDGSDGSNGSSGANGTKGNDAVVESSTNSALPTMSISEWIVSETSLQGSIYVSGGVEYLEISSTSSDSYAGSVTITNLATGEIIQCYSTQEDYEVTASSETEFTEFRQGVDLVYFSTDGNVLTPDTQYLLTVVAYYQMNDMIYSREFLTRVFYTDSSGIQIAHQESEEDSLVASVEVSDAKLPSTVSTQVFLLTASQNSSFSLTNDDNYLQKFTLYYTGSNGVVKIDENGNQTDYSPITNNPQYLTFDNLSPNTTYIARIITTSSDGLTVLTTQEIEMTTLKTAPTWDSSDVPSVYYNRVTGGFEVYRPSVTDIYGGIEEYIYTVYDTNNNVVMTKTVTPSESQPVVFYLASDTEYRVGVQVVFNDNEKLVTYDLGKSDIVKSTGDTLPSVTLDGTTYYNGKDGNITINLNSNSTLTVGADDPLTIQLYADLVTDQTIKLTNEGTVKIDNKYEITYVNTNTNTKNILIKFDNLYENTNYTLTITGSLDLNDGNESVQRIIGTVSFTTYATNYLSASWTTNSTSTTSIAEVLTLSVLETDSTSSSAYVTNELENGKVNVQLYKGTGYDRTLIGEVNYTEESDLESIYGGTGVLITESSFGVSTLQSDTNYMLVVNEVTDATYNMNLGYENTFDNVNNSYKVLTAKATPPDLLTDPTNGVLETPIYNIDATSYGATYNTSLPDDTVIGYLMEATYDNSQRLASEITYYIYEYSDFYYALVANQDPIYQDDTILKSISLPVSSSSDDVPKIAVFFSDVTFKTSIVEGETYSNGAYIYQAGDSFSRGFRYVFAYTAEYSSTGVATDISIYPYDHSDYDLYKTNYGAGQENMIYIGKNTAYILNSGMVEVPKASPLFYTYVYQTNNVSIVGDETQGTVELHYTYTDPDGTITLTTGKETQIYFDNVYMVEVSQDIDLTSVDNVDGWYSVSLPYVVEKGQSVVLDPYVGITDYNIDYVNIMTALAGGVYEAPEFTLAEIPVEWAYGEEISGSSYTNAVSIEMNPQYDLNYIEFIIDDLTISSALQRETIIDRAYALQLIFTADGATTKEFYLPISLDVYGNSTVNFSTSQLGDEYLEKEFSVTANILYDDGTQGWRLADKTYNSSNLFGLQRTNSLVNGVAIFGDENYYVYPASLQELPSGGLITGLSTFSLESLRETALQDKTYYASFSYMTGTYSTGRYLTVEHYGVNENTNNDYENLSQLYLVPKGVSTYNLTFVGEGNTGTLTTITPTIGDLTTSVSVSVAKITYFEISGHSKMDNNLVYAYVYDKEYDDDKWLSATPVDSLRLEISDEGVFTSSSLVDSELDGLTANTVYYLVFAAEIDGDITILLDTTTTDLAVYTFETIEGIRITTDDLGAVYYNFGYFEKYVQMKYTLNQYLGVSVSYDLYTSQADAESDDATPYLSHSELIELGIMSEKTLYYSNEFYLTLTPSTARDKILPGVTYYLKVTATPSGDSGAADEVTNITSFTTGTSETPTALIYANDATSESVSFMVTISDTQYSLMSDKGDSSNNGSIYTVRFTDSSGNRIYTTYDDDYYYAKDFQQEFVLDSSVMEKASDNTSLSASTTYYMHIYAVPDLQHNGLSGDTIAGDDNSEQTWDYFFDESNDSNNYTTFNNFIDSFWINVGDYTSTNNATMDSIETSFLIASRGQITTDSNNILINSSMATVSLNENSKFELMLAESYGVTTTNELTGQENQSFSSITYSISGYTNSSVPVNIYNTTSAAFIKEKDLAGYDVYTFEIPEEIEKGTYSITINLYLSDNDVNPYATLSFTYRSS